MSADPDDIAAVDGDATPADKPDQASTVDPGEIDLEPIKENWQHKGFAPRHTIMSLVAAVEALRERVTKLNGWLNEHESMLARSRRETNDSHRKLKAAEARMVELAEALERARALEKVAGYSRHTQYCDLVSIAGGHRPVCTCGLEEALAKLDALDKKEKEDA